MSLAISFCTGAYANGPDTSQTYVNSIKYSGTGCPQGTGGISISDIRQTFTLIFDSFVASTGPSVPISEARKTCTIILNLHIPVGITAWLDTTTTRGFVQLPAKLKASAQTTTVLANANAQGGGNGVEDDNDGEHHNAQSQFAGPVVKDYLSANVASFTTRNGCESRAVDLDLKIELLIAIKTPDDNSKAAIPQGQITGDSIDGALRTVKTAACDSK